MANDAATTCLLLEDDFALRSLVEMQLRDLGVARIASFETAEDALAHLAENRPAFAIVDYRLGRFRTSESVVLELLRQDIPLIIATGLGELPDNAEIFSDVTILEKPVLPDALRLHLASVGLISG